MTDPRVWLIFVKATVTVLAMAGLGIGIVDLVWRIIRRLRRPLPRRYYQL